MFLGNIPNMIVFGTFGNSFNFFNAIKHFILNYIFLKPNIKLWIYFKLAKYREFYSNYCIVFVSVLVLEHGLDCSSAQTHDWQTGPF